ncbi:MAG: 3'-5' exonuclease, partial [Halobacteria archaeon]|nr:3'-5' exonuclease [Halobacteria archaeon]
MEETGQSSLGSFDASVDASEAETGSEGSEEEVVGVTKVDYTVENDGDEPYPVVHVFGRNSGGELKHVVVEGFEPYFYAPEHEVDDPEDDERVTGTETGYESIDGEDLTRIYTRIPADVGEVREPYTHYEADILFPNRFRVDKDVKSGVKVDALDGSDGKTRVSADSVEPRSVDAPARTMVVDIEVDDRSGFPEDGEEPVICLTAWDSFEEEYHVFVQDIDASRVDEEKAEYVLHAYDDEVGMLNSFLSYLEEHDPDILTGWNSNDFDFPYLIDRLNQLDDPTMEPSRLSRVGEVWNSGGEWGSPTIKGRAT